MLFRMLAGRYPFDERTYALPTAADKDRAHFMEGDELAKVKEEQETDMVGVERKEQAAQDDVRKNPWYMLDWRPFVDSMQWRSIEG